MLQNTTLVGGIRTRTNIAGGVSPARSLSGNVDVGNTSADKTYVHTQGTAAAVWTVTHNLGKYPSVTVVDSANTVIIGEVFYLDINTVRLTFCAPFCGSAYFN